MFFSSVKDAHRFNTFPPLPRTIPSGTKQPVLGSSLLACCRVDLVLPPSSRAPNRPDLSLLPTQRNPPTICFSPASFAPRRPSLDCSTHGSITESAHDRFLAGELRPNASLAGLLCAWKHEGSVWASSARCSVEFTGPARWVPCLPPVGKE
jgi:hypothetical protein